MQEIQGPTAFLECGEGIGKPLFPVLVGDAGTDGVLEEAGRSGTEADSADSLLVALVGVVPALDHLKLARAGLTGNGAGVGRFPFGCTRMRASAGVAAVVSAQADELRAFSDQLTRCTEQAFGQATAELRAELPADQLVEGEVPVLPLVLGGDDMIAVCDGEVALSFAARYLRAFEQLTAQAPQIKEPLGRDNRGDRVAGCAGVAIVKPHFPFTSAAGLAYELMREAKAVKDHVDGPCSALSFEVLYDSTDPDLGRLRAGAVAPERGPDQAGRSTVARLTAQPYVVSGGPDAPGAWAAGRHWDELLRRAAALSRYGEDEERALPASQVQGLRDALFISVPVAEARFESLRNRYPQAHAEALAGPASDLFWAEPGGQLVTGVLDAMNAAPFLGEILASLA